MSDPEFDRVLEEGFEKAYKRDYVVFTSIVAHGFEKA